jgi:hypothetical protein
VTCGNATTNPGGVEVRGEYVRKFGREQRAGRTAVAPDLPVCLGWGLQWLQTYKLSRLKP